MAQRPIRVLQVTNSLNFGGLERLIVDLCLGLDRDRFTPMVACLKYKGNLSPELEQAGVPVIPLNEDVDPKRRYRTFRALQRLIREQGIDVVHTHNTGPLMDVLMARLTQLRGVRWVHTDHNRIHWPGPLKYRVVERVASMLIHDFVAVSPDARDNLVRYEKIPFGRIRIIDNGIAVDRFKVDAQQTKAFVQEINADAFSHRVGFVGMHRPKKGLATLLQAFPAVLAKFPNAGLIVAGGGPLEDAHQAEAEELGISDHVRFLGRRSDVPDILAAMDVYVLPSESEGLPIGLLEAMAAARPIVATAVGAVPRVLGDGEYGRLVQPCSPDALAEAINGLLADPEARQRMAERARERVVAEFSISRTVDEYAALYQQAAPRRPCDH